MESLRTFDHSGRMLRRNGPDQGIAPSFFWGRTLDGDLWRFGQGLPATLERRLADLCAAETSAADLHTTPSCWPAVIALLAADAPVTRAWAGPAYRFPEEIHQTGDAVAISSENAHLVERWFPWLVDTSHLRPGAAPELETQQPCFAVVIDGHAVSICRCATVNARASEAGLETVEEFRRQGYGANVTAAWAAAVRGRGLVPLYSTSWENVASQGVARRLGLTMYGADLSIT